MRFLRQLITHLKRDEGIALIMSLGLLLVLTIAAGTAMTYTGANERSANASEKDTVAFLLAEAGLNNALGVLFNSPPNDPTDPNLLPARTDTFETGTAVWSGAYDSANAKWTITSTGSVKNPTGIPAEDRQRTLTAKIPVRPVTTQPLAYNSWNYVFSYGTGDPTGCDMTLYSSVQINTRVMASGNFCMKESSRLNGDAQLLVGGRTKTYDSALIGSLLDPVDRVDSTNGCSYHINPVHNPCEGPPLNADKVWASTITSSPALEPAPVADLDGWYKKASPGPYKPCQTQSGIPPVFDNDQGSTPDPTKRNRSVVGSFNLTPPSTSYVCQTFLGAERQGELSWNHVTKVLTVLGTIFIDGNAMIGTTGSYTGQGTIYLSGSFVINGQRMCAVMSGSACNFSAGAWDPNTRLLAIVANGVGGQSGVDTDVSAQLDSSTEWQGAIYGGPYKIKVNSSLKFAGPLIADEVWIGSSLQGQPFMTIGTAPTGMPGNTTVNAKPDKVELFSG